MCACSTITLSSSGETCSAVGESSGDKHAARRQHFNHLRAIFDLQVNGFLGICRAN